MQFHVFVPFFYRMHVEQHHCGLIRRIAPVLAAGVTLISVYLFYYWAMLRISYYSLQRNAQIYYGLHVRTAGYNA